VRLSYLVRFENYHDFQDLIEEEDDVCEVVIAAIFPHAIPGTREGRFWMDGL
jgi:hypothetical protein